MKRIWASILAIIGLAWAAVVYGVFFRNLAAVLLSAIKSPSLLAEGKLIGLAALAPLLIVGFALWRKRSKRCSEFKTKRSRPVSLGFLLFLAIGLIGIALAGNLNLGIDIFNLLVSLGLIELVTLLLLLALNYALGHRIFSLVGIEFSSKLEDAVFSVGLGIGALAYLVFALGVLGLLYKRILVFLLIGLGIAFVPEATRFARKVFRGLRTSPVNVQLSAGEAVFATILTCILIAFVGINYICALAPETEFDALSYHLAVPQTYIAAHSIINIPHLWRSNWAFSQEMLYTLSLLLLGEPLAKLLHFLMGIWTTLAIFSFCRSHFSWRTGLLAGAIFYTIPIVSYEATTAYIELALTMYSFLACYAAYKWVKFHGDNWLGITGLFCGLALGTKYLAAFIVVAIVAGAVFACDKGKNSWGFLFKRLLWLGAITALVASPWYIKNILYTGNPVFPFLNNVFQSPFWMPVNERMDLDTHGVGKGLLELIVLPWNLTFHGSRFRGIIGPVFLAFLPVALLRMVREIKYLLATSVTFLILWFFSGQVMRYLIPILALLSIVVAYGVERLCNFEARIQRIVLALVLGPIMVGLILNVPSNIALWQREGVGHIITKFPLKVILGQEREDRYLSRHVPGYEVYKFLAANVASSARIFTIGADFQYLCPQSLISVFSFQGSQIRNASKDENRFLQKLRELDIAYVMIDRVWSPFKRDKGLGLARDSPFVNQHLSQLHDDGRFYLYELSYDELLPEPSVAYDFIDNIHNAQFLPLPDVFPPPDLGKNAHLPLWVGENRECLVSVAPGQIRYKVSIPPEAMLAFGLGMPDWRQGDGALAQIILINQDGQHELFSQYLNPAQKPGDRRWFDYTMDLTRFADEKVVIKFLADVGPAGNATADWIGWSTPQIVAIRQLSSMSDPLRVETGGNLVENPGFEADDDYNGVPDDWLQYGNPVYGRRGIQSHRGKCAVLADEQNGHVFKVPVAELTTYTLSHYAKGVVGGQQGRLQINWLDNLGEIIGASIEVFTATTRCTKRSITVTAPKGATMADIYASSATLGDKAWYDDYRFEEKPKWE